jgi:hypothetical protein
VSRVQSWLAAPLGARLLGVAFALAGVALLVLGVFAFGGSGSSGSGAAPAPSATVSPSTGAPSTAAPTTAPTTVPPTTAPSRAPTSRPAPTTPAPPTGAPAPVRVPLTVLNNSTVRGLGERAAAEARARGWTVASIGNFAGVIPVTTVYYTPGDPVQQTAAERLKMDLPQIERVMPRYEGLPPTPTGVVLVVTRDWS